METSPAAAPAPLAAAGRAGDPATPDASTAPDPPPGSRARTIALLVIPVATLGASAVGTALAPTLLVTWPEMLLALDPRPTNLVLTAPSVPVMTYFVIAITRWFIADPFLYEVGRKHGPAAIAWVLPRSGKFGAMALPVLVRWIDRAAFPILFFFSGPLPCLLVGARGMPRGQFLVANLVGSLVVVAGLRFFGGYFAAPIATLVAFVSANLVLLTAITCAFVAIVTFLRWRRKSLGTRLVSPE